MLVWIDCQPAEAAGVQTYILDIGWAVQISRMTDAGFHLASRIRYLIIAPPTEPTEGI